jgi:general secretion pathway protein B
MSYILDALNRADTERERAAAPSLHSRHTMPEALPAVASASFLRAWRVLEVVAIGGFAVLGWWWWQGNSQAPQMAAQNSPVLAVPPAAPTPVVIAPVAQLQASAAAPMPMLAAVSLPASSVPNRPAPQAKQALPAAAPLASVPLLSDLPESLRSQLPKLTITGVVFSEQAAQRLLLVNNLVLNEGTELSKELRLERIQPHSSEFSFRGTRFRLPH